MKICEICGKSCKNQRGLKIHFGHMHKKQEELQVIEQKIVSLEEKLDFVIAYITEKGIAPNLPKVPFAPSSKPKKKKENNGIMEIANKIALEYKSTFEDIKDKFSCFKDFEKWG